MNTDRIREIQEDCAFPDSHSVQQALLQVWNECAQEAASPIPSSFMIGQRVIYSGVICTVCMPEDSKISFDPNNPHIMNPEKGYIHWASKDNLKPLPNGQL